MELLEVKDLGDRDVLFVSLSNNELIKGMCTEFNHEEKTVTWRNGVYYGNVKNYIHVD